MKKLASCILTVCLVGMPFSALAEETERSNEEVTEGTQVEVGQEDSITPPQDSVAEGETPKGEEPVLNGWVFSEDTKTWSYFINNEKATGWITDNGKRYFLNDKGIMVTGWVKEQGIWYYLSKSGVMQTGWVYDAGRWYFMNDDGMMKTGWLNDNMKWYFLSGSGAMKTGWVKDQGKWYYLNTKGVMQKGWIQDSKNWYFLKDSGAMVVGWFQDGDKWYYTYSSGAMAKNTTIGGYYLGKSGMWLPNVVNPKQTYTYDQMLKDIDKIKALYPDLVHIEVIGKSVDGRDIVAVKVGKGNKEIFLNGSHHAREHITTNLLMEMIDEYTAAYADNAAYSGYYTRDILSQVSIWFVPMVNPDGVTLVQKGHTSAKNPAYVLQLNNNSTDFSSWKANIRGVDLNRQYPAGWGLIKGPTQPAPANFKGYQSLSEPEVQAIYNFTKAHSFKTAVAYHSSGEILYWYYKQSGSNYDRDYLLAQKLSNITGYSLVKPVTEPGGGGFKDWFIQEMKQPGFTPEVSTYTYGKPVPIGHFDEIWGENKSIGLMLAKEAMNR